MFQYDLSVLEKLTPGEAALLDHFRALPLQRRRALLNALEAEVSGNDSPNSAPTADKIVGLPRKPRSRP